MDPMPGPPPADEPKLTRPAYGDAAPTEIEQNKDARTWGMLAHLSCLVGYLGVPSVLGPLVVWLIKKDEYPFVDDQAKEALNFHICVLIVAAIAIPAIFCFLIGVVILIALGIFVLVVTIMAAVKANQGIYYRYPLNIRMIK